MKRLNWRRMVTAGVMGAFVLLIYLSAQSIGIAPARTPPLAPGVLEGKAVWKEAGCADCHTVLGQGAHLATDLAGVYGRRTETELHEWITAPQIIAPGTTMPRYPLSDEGVENLIAYFRWLNQIDPDAWPPIRP